MAIRVPDQVVDDPLPLKPKFTTQARIINQGEKVAIVAVGSTFPLAQKVVNTLQTHQINATLIDPVCVSDLDEKLLNTLTKNHTLVITLEEGALNGGFGQKIAAYFGDCDIKVKNFGFTKGLTHDFEPEAFLKLNGLTVKNITDYILKNQ